MSIYVSQEHRYINNSSQIVAANLSRSQRIVVKHKTAELTVVEPRSVDFEGKKVLLRNSREFDLSRKSAKSYYDHRLMFGTRYTMKQIM